MQDTLEYGTRTHHSNADLYDRVQKDDVMQGSLIEAWFAYNAATRAEMLPTHPNPGASDKVTIATGKTIGVRPKASPFCLFSTEKSATQPK